MSTKHRTPAETKLWDAIVVQLVRKCFVAEIGAVGCAHLVREIADAVIRERRESIAQDK